MKKTCNSCYYGAYGRKTYNNTMTACQKLGVRVRLNKQRAACKYWRPEPPRERARFSYFGGF